MDPRERTQNTALETLPPDDDPVDDQNAPVNPETIEDVKKRLEERVDDLPEA